MLLIIFWFFAFFLSFIVLIKSSNSFIKISENLGKRIGLSVFFTGFFLVALGTSIPELVTSLISSSQGFSNIGSSNVIGSNITNILLVMGVTSVLSYKKIKTNKFLSPDNIFLVVASVFFFLFSIDKVIEFYEGGFLLVLLFISGFYLYNGNNNKNKKIKKNKEFYITIVKFVIYGGLIVLSGKFVVDSIINIVKLTSISSDLISIILLALGTSLPELSVNISAVLNKKPNLALGNIVGSNIFNILAVMGITALFYNVKVDPKVFSLGFPFLFLSLFLYLVFCLKKNTGKKEGVILLLTYLAFLVLNFIFLTGN